MTSALERLGKEILKKRTTKVRELSEEGGGRLSKNLEILRTSYLEGPNGEK